jgi:hypothetical protein
MGAMLSSVYATNIAGLRIVHLTFQTPSAGAV